MKESKTGEKTTQEIVIRAFDIKHMIFGSGNGDDRITTTVYEIRTSPIHAATLNSILCKASHPDNHSLVQFIPYGIQGITHKEIHKNMIKKQNAFIKKNSIVPVYDIKERDLAKFNKLIDNTKYVQSMEITNESTSKEIFLITTNKDYKQAVMEVKTMIKYIYPEREEDERQDYQRANTPIIHNNVSTYAQALMIFHEDNPVPTNNSNTRLKIQFREQTPTSKRDAPKEVTFLDIDDPTPAEEHIRMQPTQHVNRHSNPSDGRSQAERGATGGRGGQGGRGYDRSTSSLKEPVPLPHPWRNEVDNLIRDMRIDIMKEIELAITTAISSQISEIAKAMATQIKEEISIELSTTTKDNMTMSPMELEEDLDPITQSPKMNKEDSTPMEEDIDQRKRKVPTDIEASTTTHRITPSRNLRPQKHRGLVSTPKKTLKEGQKTD